MGQQALGVGAEEALDVHCGTLSCVVDAAGGTGA